MHIKLFHPDLLVDRSLVPDLFDTLEWCEAKKLDAKQLVSEARTSANDIKKAAQDKADRLIARTERKLDKCKSELEAEREKIVAEAAKERAEELAAAVRKIEANVAELLTDAMKRIFDITSSEELVTGAVRRALEQDGDYEDLIVRLSTDERDGVQKLLGERANVRLIADSGLKSGQVHLVTPHGTTDLSPGMQLESFLQILSNPKGSAA